MTEVENKKFQDATDLRRIKNIINTSEVISRGGKFVALSMKSANEISLLLERLLS